MRMLIRSLVSVALLLLVSTCLPARPAAADPTSPCSARAAAATTDDLGTAELRALRDWAVAFLSAPEHLSRGLGVPAWVVVCDKPSGTLSAETLAFYGAPSGGEALTHCAVVVYPKGVTELTDSTLSRATFAHEMFHCFMAALLSKAGEGKVSGWLNEGAAAWVGEVAVGGSTQSSFWWQGYLTEPRDRLFSRTPGYSAIGFFAHMAESGIDPWAHLDDMFRANSGLKSAPLGMNSDQYAFSLGVADNPSMLDTWPTGLARDASLGPGWDATGPGITDDAYSRPPLAMDSPLKADESANDLRSIDIEGDIIRLVVDSPSDHAEGQLRASDGTLYPLNTADLCGLPDGCTCPSDSPQAAAAAALPPLSTGNALLAVSGHVPTQAVPAAGSQVTIRSLSLDAYCAAPSAPPTPAGGGATTPTGAPAAAATSNDATCGPWFGTGWYATFNLTAPDSGDLWIVQVIVEPDVYAGDGDYAEETDTSSYGARVNVTNGRGIGWGALIKAPGEPGDFGTMGGVSIGNGGRSGSAHVLLELAPDVGQTWFDYTWTCSRIQ